MNVTTNNPEEQRVLALEDEYIAAEVHRDEAALRRILDDRFMLKSNNGTTASKAELIERILGWNMTGQTIRERSVLVVGDVAIVAGTAALSFASEGDEDTESVYRYTTTYIKRENGWRLIGMQMAVC